MSKIRAKSDNEVCKNCTIPYIIDLHASISNSQMKVSGRTKRVGTKKGPSGKGASGKGCLIPAKLRAFIASTVLAIIYESTRLLHDNNA